MTDTRKTTANDLGNALNTIANGTATEPQRQTYRGYVIHYDPKPVPLRIAGSWSFYAQDYDGPGDSRNGFGADPQDCRNQIDEQLSDLEDEAEEAARDRFEPSGGGGLREGALELLGVTEEEWGTGLEPRKTFTVVSSGYGSYYEVWETVDGRSCRSQDGKNPFDFNGWWRSKEDAQAKADELTAEEQKSK